MSFDPPQTCTECEDDVHALSSRGWCDFCEAEAERDSTPVIVPEPVATLQPAVGETVMLPEYAVEIAELLAETEGSKDATVRAVRKMVVQGAVALRALTQSPADVAKTTPASAPPAVPSGSEPTAADYRRWATVNGIPCAANGRVPQSVKDAYNTQHGTAA